MPKQQQMSEGAQETKMSSCFAQLWNDEQATTTLEYTLILVLIAVTGLLAWQSFGTSLSEHAADNAAQVGVPDANKYSGI